MPSIPPINKHYHLKLENYLISPEMEPKLDKNHYNDVIMSAIASWITSFTIVYSTCYSGADQRKHKSSASLPFPWGIYRWPVNFPHKGLVTRKMFPFNDVIQTEYTHNCVCRHLSCYITMTLHEHDVSNHRQPHCLFTSVLWITTNMWSMSSITPPLCDGNPPVTCDYPTQKASTAEKHAKASIWVSLTLVRPFPTVLGPVSISVKTSYCKISRNLEAARFAFRTDRSLWNFTGASAAVLPRCLSNLKAMR